MKVKPLRMTVTQSSINKAVNTMSKRVTEYEKNVANEIFKAGLNTESKAKQNVPVKTGTLRASIQTEFDNKEPSATVGSNVHYAPYVEFGTGQYAKEYLAGRPASEQDLASEFKGSGERVVNRQAKPFLFPAFYAEARELTKRIKKAKI